MKGYFGISEKKMEAAISGVGFRDLNHFLGFLLFM